MALKGICRLLRLPLFATAVADVLAGYTVALLPDLGRFDLGRAALLAGTSAGLYLFGLVENDLADRRRDRYAGAARPLATGETSVAAAVVLLVLTAGLAAACTAFLPGAAVLLSITTFATINLYNLSAKRGPSYVAMPVMGLCRLFNVGIGVSAAVGIPSPVSWALLWPTGPIWVRHAAAVFFATVVITGYSIAARARLTVSSRPWTAAAVVAAVGGFALFALPAIAEAMTDGATRVVPPAARIVSALVLALLWPGGIRSDTGPQRLPAEYAPFVERMLYWFILMDAAFVLDGLMIY